MHVGDFLWAGNVNFSKRALGPWVTHLRMTVYKGIGKHNYEFR